MTIRRATLCALLALALGAAPAQAAFPGRDGALATTLSGRQMVTVDPTTGRQRTLGLPFGGLDLLRYSPDGSRLFGIKRGAYVWTSAASGFGRRELTAPDPSGPGPTAEVTGTDVAPAPDGRLALAFGRNSIRVFDGTDTGRKIVDVDRGYPRELAWSPDGRRIAFTQVTDAGVGIWSVGADGSGLAPLTQLPPPDANQFGYSDTSPDFSPDGSKVVFLRAYAAAPPYGGDVMVLDLTTGAVTKLTDTHDAHQVVWSPSGTRIATLGGSFMAGTLRTMDADGSDGRTLRTFDRRATGLSWQPRP